MYPASHSNFGRPCAISWIFIWPFFCHYASAPRVTGLVCFHVCLGDLGPRSPKGVTVSGEPCTSMSGLMLTGCGNTQTCLQLLAGILVLQVGCIAGGFPFYDKHTPKISFHWVCHILWARGMYGTRFPRTNLGSDCALYLLILR